jgi:hypothetical protein
MAAKTPKQKRQWLYVYLTGWILKPLGQRIIQATSMHRENQFSQKTTQKLVKLIADANNLAEEIKENYTNNLPL